MSYLGNCKISPGDGWVSLSDAVNFMPNVGDYYNFSLEGDCRIRWCQQDEKPTNENDGILIYAHNFGYYVKTLDNIWVKAIFFDTLISID